MRASAVYGLYITDLTSHILSPCTQYPASSEIADRTSVFTSRYRHVTRSHVRIAHPSLDSHYPHHISRICLFMNDSEYIIEATKSWFHVPWREIVRYRDLLFLLVRRDFVAKYKQTVLGPLWFVIQPVLTTWSSPSSSARWPRSRPTACRQCYSTCAGCLAGAILRSALAGQSQPLPQTRIFSARSTSRGW